MEDGAEVRRSQTAATSEELAQSAFALLQKLEVDAPLKAPSVLTVFQLYCVDGFSSDRVARKCRCAKGTVMSRLRFIEERTGVRAGQFSAMSGYLQQIDDDLPTSGAKEIYRRGLARDAGHAEVERDQSMALFASMSLSNRVSGLPRLASLKGRPRTKFWPGASRGFCLGFF